MAEFLTTHGPDIWKFAAFHSWPLGRIVIATDGCALTGLFIQGQKYFAEAMNGKPGNNHPVLAQVKEWLVAYFAGARPNPRDLPLAPAGTPFQQAVWQLLLEISYGSCVAYGDIAREIAGQRGVAKMSAQAVGGAVGHNPLAIVIPCHRVIGKNGKLTGYGGGLDLKQWLLRHEGHEIERNMLNVIKKNEDCHSPGCLRISESL